MGFVTLMGLATAGCLGNPNPEVHGSGSVNVTLIGDSLLWQAGPYVAAALAWDGVTATVDNKAIGGTGMLDDQHAARVAADLDATPAGSVVIFQYSGNCFFSVGGGCPFDMMSPEFYNAWRAQMIADTEYAKSKGFRVLWVASPPFAPPGVAPEPAGDHYLTVAALANVTQEVAAQEGVGFIDWRVALTDYTGAYQSVLWYADIFAAPTWHTVRDPDGIHFTEDGARRAATWTAAGIVNMMQR